MQIKRLINLKEWAVSVKVQFTCPHCEKAHVAEITDTLATDAPGDGFDDYSKEKIVCDCGKSITVDWFIEIGARIVTESPKNKEQLALWLQ